MKSVAELGTIGQENGGWLRIQAFFNFFGKFVATTAWGVGSDPLLSRKRMVVESWARRYSKDLDETHLKNFRKLQIEVTCQVKVRSNVKIRCIQIADGRDLKISIFTQIFP